MKNSLLILNMALFSNLLTAANSNSKIEMPGLFAQSLGKLARSRPVYWYNQNVAGLMRPRFISELASREAQVITGVPADPVFRAEPATSKYQILGKEAQEAIGVPADRILPIKKIAPDSPLTKLVDGFAEPDAIYISEGALEELPLGRQRAILFHEACHAKYNDAATNDLIKGIAILSGGALAHKAIKAIKPAGEYNLLYVAGVFLAAGIAKKIAGIKYRNFTERRADLEGHYALQCATCVQEAAKIAKKAFKSGNPIMSKGYLSPVELTTIAIGFEQQNKKCADHI